MSPKSKQQSTNLSWEELEEKEAEEMEKALKRIEDAENDRVANVDGLDDMLGAGGVDAFNQKLQRYNAKRGKSDQLPLPSGAPSEFSAATSSKGDKEEEESKEPIQMDDLPPVIYGAMGGDHVSNAPKHRSYVDYSSTLDPLAMKLSEQCSAQERRIEGLTKEVARLTIAYESLSAKHLALLDKVSAVEKDALEQWRSADADFLAIVDMASKLVAQQKLVASQALKPEDTQPPQGSVPLPPVPLPAPPVAPTQPRKSIQRRVFR